MHRDDLGPKLETFERGAATFNISHSHNTVCCLVADMGAVGVDIERIDRCRGVDKLAQVFFSEAEICALNALPSDQLHAYFYRLWTLKECTIKAKMQGISTAALKELCFAELSGRAGVNSHVDSLSYFAFRLAGFQIACCLGSMTGNKVDIRVYKPGVRQSRQINPAVQCYIQAAPIS